MSKERDLHLWLQSKLEDPWSGENLASLLKEDMLCKIANEFETINSQVKVKILIA